MVRFTFGDEQSNVHHLFQVPLQRPPVDFWIQALEVLDGQAAVLKDVSEGFFLAILKAVLLDDHVPADGLFSSLFDLGKLRIQAIDKILQPAGLSAPPTPTVQHGYSRL